MPCCTTEEKPGMGDDAERRAWKGEKGGCWGNEGERRKWRDGFGALVHCFIFLYRNMGRENVDTGVRGGGGLKHAAWCSHVLLLEHAFLHDLWVTPVLHSFFSFELKKESYISFSPLLSSLILCLLHFSYFLVSLHLFSSTESPVLMSPISSASLVTFLPIFCSPIGPFPVFIFLSSFL